MEIYRITGGGALGSPANATRTLKKVSGYTVDRTVYNETERAVTITTATSGLLTSQVPETGKYIFKIAEEKIPIR